MRFIYLLIPLFVAARAFATTVDLPAGSYQLVCAHDDGPSASGRGPLWVRHVKVVAADAKLSIVIDGVTALVRRDEFGGVLFTLPSNEDVKGAAVAQVLYVGSDKSFKGSSIRIEGVYRILWPNGEEKGRFALVRDDENKG